MDKHLHEIFEEYEKGSKCQCMAADIVRTLVDTPDLDIIHWSQDRQYKLLQEMERIMNKHYWNT